MKPLRKVTRIVLAALLTLFSLVNTACTIDHTKTEFIDDNGERPDAEGQSTGGGSMGDESANYILEAAQKDLIAKLNDTGRPLMVDFPEGWSAGRMQEMLKNIKVSKNKPVVRHGVELMFNYESRPEHGGPYIEAVKWFYSTYGGKNINHMEREEFAESVNEVKLKLLHEVAHLMKIGVSKETDDEARKFATAVLINAGRNAILCEGKEPISVGTPWIKFASAPTYNRYCMKEHYEEANREDAPRWEDGSIRFRGELAEHHEFPTEELHLALELPSGKAFQVDEDSFLLNDIFKSERHMTYYDITHGHGLWAQFWELPRASVRLGFDADLHKRIGSNGIRGSGQRNYFLAKPFEDLHRYSSYFSATSSRRSDFSFQGIDAIEGHLGYLNDLKDVGLVFRWWANYDWPEGRPGGGGYYSASAVSWIHVEQLKEDFIYDPEEN
ncbi:MAG: hypothetical protein AAF202_02520, partial [Pseudomonadota bacterium]